MIKRCDKNQPKGVALVTALFVIAIFSFLLAAILADVEGELKMSGVERNSERALKIAEAGVQIARSSVGGDATFLNLTGSLPLIHVDGFINGGYFFTTLGSGMPSDEKWTQWHYDSQLAGNNFESSINTPLWRVWGSGAQGTNGTWFKDGDWYLNVQNLYAIVAGGVYFTIEKTATLDTAVRAHDEYSGETKIANWGQSMNPVENTSKPAIFWEGDKMVARSAGTGSNNNYALKVSPMASFSNVSTIPTKLEHPTVVTQQTLYFTYAGGATTADQTATTKQDLSSTVRLRASNAQCNDSSSGSMNVLWEYDTNIHGIGSAPTVFDPSPDEPGDEIIYFVVTAMPNNNLYLDPSLSATDYDTLLVNNLDYPNNRNSAAQNDVNRPEQIYVFAVVDTTGVASSCTATGTYVVKWAHPYPDPDVVNWTDYPTEHATGTNGQFPPYMRVPSDESFTLPEDDVLPDYRKRTPLDSRQGQVRGNVYNLVNPPSVSHPILNVLYRLNSGALTKTRDDTLSSTTPGNPADPIIDVYVAYAAYTRAKWTMETGGNINRLYTTYWDRAQWNGADLGNGWTNGIPNNRKHIAVQTRILALRDRVSGACDSSGKSCVSNWNWGSARSRFPVIKWNYRLPAWDPTNNDQRPWNGYGEYVWDTWFEQQGSPSLGVASKNQDGALWANVGGSGSALGGQQNLYNVIYPVYESQGVMSNGNAYWTLESTDFIAAPSATEGFPVTLNAADWDAGNWDNSHVLVMPVRDTWDDYIAGNQTNPLFGAMVTQNNPMAIRTQSNPVEPYWTHQHDGTISGTDGSILPYFYPNSTETVITYPGDGTATLNANADKVGFPRPYAWWDSLWNCKVLGLNAAGAACPGKSTTRTLSTQGWKDEKVNLSWPSWTLWSRDIDVLGPSTAFCQDCQSKDGLLVTSFYEDLYMGVAWTSNPALITSYAYRDLRLHGINARTGRHIWDYHVPVNFAGTYTNGTPAIGNNKVFVGSQKARETRLTVVDAETGAYLGESRVDNNSDALILSPTIANGTVYVATLNLNETATMTNYTRVTANDYIRLFALSPVLRLTSIGIYPISTSLTLETQQGKGYLMPRAERKLQVNITGAGSKWEETREVYK